MALDYKKLSIEFTALLNKFFHEHTEDEIEQILKKYDDMENEDEDKLEFLKRDVKPYTCPICGGNGLVPNGFYNQTSGQWGTTSTTPETCRSCNGTGIVWG
ncbi:MAG: hypothetical protein M0P71_13010 [Melioribacteraceae bacterium]|jgi:rubrerythrin|nr:hypothetical protein [Melioribacteraceae bacterium]